MFRARHLAPLALLFACAAEPDPTGLPEPLARHAPAAAPAQAPAPPPPLPAVISTCDELAAAAAVHPPDAALLLALCPDTPAGPAVLRHALAMADSPAAAAALRPRLAGLPDLAGLARLAALDRPGVAAPAELPDPVAATVSPVTDAVLAAVQLALVQQTAAGVSHEQRVRATAYLARVHHEALLQLGAAEPPLSPFARVLAGRFLHHGRELCRMYWQRRVAGLEGLFTATEAALAATVVALERTPHAVDDALLAVERQRSRRHLQGPGVAERLARSAGPTPAELLPLPHEFDRLLDHGFVELAVQRLLFLGGEPGGLGLGPAVEFLRGVVAPAAPGARDLREYAATLERRISEARALVPPPPEHGRGLPARVPLPWPDADAAADAAARWLDTAADRTDLTRRHALARAALLLHDRPDAARVLLARQLAAAPRDPARVGLLLDLLARHDDDSLAALRLRAAADPTPPTGDAAVRRAFARASREAGLLPR